MSDSRSEGPIRTIQGGPLDGTPTLRAPAAVGFVTPGGGREHWFPCVPVEFAYELAGIRYRYQVDAELVIRWTGESRTICG